MKETRRAQLDEKLEKRMKQGEKQGQRVNMLFRQLLHWLERLIAAITILVLVGNLAIECWRLIVNPCQLSDLSHILHALLGIVVGLEFVRMLIDTTPANIIEVLVLAITRYVVLTHEDPWSNLVSIVCIAILFAVRRFLIRPDELQEEIVETE